MKSLIRKNKDKSSKRSQPEPPAAPPSLALPAFISADPSSSTFAPLPAPTANPSVTASFPPLASSPPTDATSPSAAPLYARFARGTFDLSTPPASSPPAQDQLSPPQTLRHRASHESGSGFRSGGVRDEVERLAVAKRSMGAGARGASGRDSPSVRSVSGGASVRSRSPSEGGATRSLGVVLPVVLPRPPTPPPPSPPRQRFAKLPKVATADATAGGDASSSATAALTSAPTSTPFTPTSPTPALPSLAPTSPFIAPASPSLQPPTSPGRRTYSPLAAFGLAGASAGSIVTPTSPSTPAVPNVQTSAPPPLSLNTTTSPNPAADTPPSSSSPRGSPVNGPGFASLLRAASVKGGPTSPVRATSPIKNGTGNAEDDDDDVPLGMKVGTGRGSRGRGLYFSQYPGRSNPSGIDAVTSPKTPTPNGNAIVGDLDLNLDNATFGETNMDRRARRGRFNAAKQSSIDDANANATTAYPTSPPASASTHTSVPHTSIATSTPTRESESRTQDTNTTPTPTHTHTHTPSRIAIANFNVNTNIPPTSIPTPPSTTPSTSRTTTPTPTTPSFPSRSGSTTPSRMTPSRIGTPSRSNTTSNSNGGTPSRSNTKSESVRERVRRLEEEGERERERERERQAGVNAGGGTGVGRRASLLAGGGVGVMGSMLGVGVVVGEKEKERERERKESSGSSVHTTHARERSAAKEGRERERAERKLSEVREAPGAVDSDLGLGKDREPGIGAGKERERKSSGVREKKISNAKVDKESAKNNKEREKERKGGAAEGGSGRELKGGGVDNGGSVRERKTSGVGVDGSRERKISTTKDRDRDRERERKSSTTDRDRKSSTAATDRERKHSSTGTSRERERKSSLRTTKGASPTEEGVPVPLPPLPPKMLAGDVPRENGSAATTPNLSMSVRPDAVSAAIAMTGSVGGDRAASLRDPAGAALRTAASSASTVGSVNGVSNANGNGNGAVRHVPSNLSINTAASGSGSGAGHSVYNGAGAGAGTGASGSSFNGTGASHPASSHNSAPFPTYTHAIASNAGLASASAPTSTSTSSNLRSAPSAASISSNGTTYIPSQTHTPAPLSASANIHINPTTGTSTSTSTSTSASTSTMPNVAGIGAGNGHTRRKLSQFELDADPFARAPISVSAPTTALRQAAVVPAQKGDGSQRGKLPPIPMEEEEAGGEMPLPAVPSKDGGVWGSGVVSGEGLEVGGLGSGEREGRKHRRRGSREERRDVEEKEEGADENHDRHARRKYEKRSKAEAEVEASYRQSTVSTYSDSEDAESEPTVPYPLERHLIHPYLLHRILRYLSYTDVLALLSVNRGVRHTLTEIRDLREEVLERFLSTVGYVRWVWDGKEGLVLTLKDLNAYLRGVSTPTHEYASIADAHIAQQGSNGVPSSRILRSLAASCRAFTRLVVRLREQAEAEHAAKSAPTSPMGYPAPPSPFVYPMTTPSSPLVPVPATPNPSGYVGHPGSPPSTSGHGAFSTSPTPAVSASSSPKKTHARQASAAVSFHSRRSSVSPSADSHMSTAHATSTSTHSLSPSSPVSARRFSSPLFRLHHAPLLRLFVPSPSGAWLSDESVLECEKELKRSGVMPLLRAGDVVWDTAVVDEGNAGRLVWDGNYLIDLDYGYSAMGELPRYMHSLSFPPSYFHKVIRTNGNPLCQLDISPWGADVAQNVQLLQDRVITEIPQGSNHTVLRWIHRSRFQILPDTPIPDSEGLIVHPKWVGTVVIESEGTNEGLGDLLGRCGEEVAAKAVTNTGGLSVKLGKGDAGRVFRILRARSRPGEIWIRCVMEKERLA